MTLDSGAAGSRRALGRLNGEFEAVALRVAGALGRQGGCAGCANVNGEIAEALKGARPPSRGVTRR